MADQPQNPPVADPGNVPEALCDGQFNVTMGGGRATITFTHQRPDASTLFAEGKINMIAVVRARVVLSMDNLIALRDLLNRVISTPDKPAPPAGGPTVH
jgi:hypothetical protein